MLLTKFFSKHVFTIKFLFGGKRKQTACFDLVGTINDFKLSEIFGLIEIFTIKSLLYSKRPIYYFVFVENRDEKDGVQDAKVAR